MPRRIVAVLGAGFSKPAGGPLLRDLLEPSWIARSDLTGSEQSLLSVLGQTLAGPNRASASSSVEGLFTDIWIRAKTGGKLSLPQGDYKGEYLLGILQRHLASLTRHVHLRRGSETWRDYKEFFEKSAHRSRQLTVVSFNYDLLGEQILDDAGLRYDFGDVPDIRIDSGGRKAALTRCGSEVSLLKLHGSIAWGVCHGCRSAEEARDVASIFEEPYIPRHRRSCPYCSNGLLDPGLVPPVIGKAGEIGYKYGLWERARRALGRSTEIVVIGYSLPSTDPEARSLLSDGSSSPDLSKVTIICGPRGASETMREVFPTATDAHLTFEGYLAQRR